MKKAINLRKYRWWQWLIVAFVVMLVICLAVIAGYNIVRNIRSEQAYAKIRDAVAAQQFGVELIEADAYPTTVCYPGTDVQPVCRAVQYHMNADDCAKVVQHFATTNEEASCRYIIELVSFNNGSYEYLIDIREDHIRLYVTLISETKS